MIKIFKGLSFDDEWSFCEVLKCIRINLNFTQEAMARFFTVPVSSYKSWEYGKCLPNTANIDTIYNKLRDTTFGHSVAEDVRRIALNERYENSKYGKD